MPAQRIDALDIFRLNKPGYCLSGAYDILQSGLLVHVKNPKMFPIDLRRYDDSWVYDNLTEADPPEGWDDPNSIKVHIANGGRGNRICKRFITTLPDTVQEPDSPYMVIKNGQWDFVPHTVLATRYTLYPPMIMDWGGDVGVAQTYKLSYQYNGKPMTGGGLVYPDLEDYYYPQPSWGLSSWQHFKLINGKYVPDGKPALSNRLQTLADWQKTYPDLKEFTYILPFLR